MSNKKNGSDKVKIGLIGVGMVGDPIRRWFEEVNGYVRGKELFCYDADPKRGFTDDVNKADVVFIAVPTPPNPDGSCNTSIVESVLKQINDRKIVVIKSTIPPGTVERLQQAHPNKHLIFNPEFLTESQAWLDYIKPDRQIIGHTKKSFSDAKEVLSVLPKAHFERPWSSDYSKKDINATEAELVKYASNVFGYIKVIYGNILADVAHGMNINFEKQGIDAKVNYENVRETMGADPRIGLAWLNVAHGNYAGAGGYCFPKDMNAFIAFIEDLIEKLSKKKENDMIVKNLEAGVGVLKAVDVYNRTLLKWQGLTIADVSYHDKEIVLNKRKPIRVEKE